MVTSSVMAANSERFSLRLAAVKFLDYLGSSGASGGVLPAGTPWSAALSNMATLT
jgi:hypothetical protein